MYFFQILSFEYDDAFFQPDWAGACWIVVGSEIGLLLGWSAGFGCGANDLQSLNMALLCKDKKKKGPAGASPVAAPIPESVSF